MAWPTSAFAQSGAWTWAGGTGRSWSTTANWTSGTVASGSGNTATFQSASSGTTVLDTDRTIGGISHNNNNLRVIEGAGVTLTLATTAGSTPILSATTGATLGISAAIAGTQGIRKTGTGTLVLGGTNPGGTNTFSGTAFLQTGTTNIQNTSGLGASGAGNETVVSSGAQLQIQTGALPVTIAESFSIAGRGNPTNIAASNGGAIRILASDVTLSGGITLTGTTEIFPNSASTLTIAGPLTGTGGFIARGSGAFNITGNMSYDGWFNRWTGGSGVVTLSGSNSYTGATAIDSGPATLNNAYALPAATALSVTGVPGVLDLNGYDTTIRTFGWRTDGVNTTNQNNSNGGTITDNSATPGTSTITVTSGSFILGTAINDGVNGRKVAVRVAGDNLSTLRMENASSTFSGGLTLLTGPGSGTRLRFEDPVVSTGSPGAITSSPLGTGTVTLGLATTDKAQFYMGENTVTGGAGSTILNDFVFNTALGTDTAGGVLLNATEAIFAGTLVAGQAPVSFVTGAQVPNSVAVLTGRVTSTGIGGGLRLVGNGQIPGITVRLASAGTPNDYQGSTTVDANTTLALGAANQIPNGAGRGNVSVAGSFNLGGFSDTINGLSGSGIVDGSSGTPMLTVGDGDATASFGGVLRNTAGTLSLIKIGSGTQTLTGVNTYSGSTSVSAGTLLVNGNQSGAAGAMTVASGATLGGSGTIGGAVTVNGVLSPGNSPGVLNLASVVLAGASTSLFEINTTARGTGYDGVDISNVSGLTYGGALSLSFGNGSAFVNDTTFDLFNFTGTPSGDFSSVTSTGFYAGTWTLSSGSWSLDSGGQKLSFTPSTGDLVIAVPEPSTLVLLAGVTAAGTGLIRRRRPPRDPYPTAHAPPS